MRFPTTLTAFLAASAAFAATDALEEGFRNPPPSARPHTWYHMMNGNVTKEGVTCDFEAIAGAGLGGVQMFDAGCEIPPGGLDFNSPAWFDLLRHAASEAKRLGLEICVPNCSGWSSSGGPWIAPSNGMKFVSCSEVKVTGPKRFSGRLPREKDDHGFYADIGVFAFPTPSAERPLEGVETVLLADGFSAASERPFEASGFFFRLDAGWLWSGDATYAVEVSDDGEAFRPLETFVTPLARSGSRDATLRFHAFAKPVTMRALKVTLKRSSAPVKLVEARPARCVKLSDLAAKTFAVRMDVRPDDCACAPDQVVEGVLDITSSLSPSGELVWDVPAGDWTIVRAGYLCNGRRNHPASDHGVGLEVDKLSAAAMDRHFEQYVGRLCRELGPLAGDVPAGLNNILVDSYEVGSQNWTQAMEAEFRRRNGYSVRPWMPVFAGYVIGSVERTERFLEDFRRTVADLFAENYSLALTRKCHEYGLQCSIEPYGNCPADNLQYGECVDIPMGEFWSNASNPYGTGCGNARFAAHIAHVWGRRYCATESFTAAPGKGSGRWMTTPFSIKAQGDSAFADGVNRIVYHRFTHQPWPGAKYLPGMTMGRWGMHLDRTQTWWGLAKPWFDYQARCQHLLQEGTFVADVLFFAGEQAPNQGNNTDGTGEGFAYSLPEGHQFDVAPSDAIYALKVVDGELVVPGGVRYRLLAIPPLEAVSPRMMTRLVELAAQGAKIAWSRKPVRAPGLRYGESADAKVRELADALWANGGVVAATGAEALERLGVAPDVASAPKAAKKLSWIHRRGDGADWYFVAMANRAPAVEEVSFRVTGREPEIWDAESGATAPADVWREEGGRTVVAVPFATSGSKFVVFRRSAPEKAHATACVATRGDLADAVWCADGLRAFAPVTVELSSSDGAKRRLAANPPAPVPVDGAWKVVFPSGYLPNALAPDKPGETVDFPALASWTESEVPGIRYFSGTAEYVKKVRTPSLGEGDRLVLDLGAVREFAEVTVNGHVHAPLWKPPFRLDITDDVRPGAEAELRIRVTNLWANRLIGDDVQFADDCEWKGEVRNGVKEIGIKEIPRWVKEGRRSPTGRVTFTTWKHWDRNDAPLPSGLLGPVRLRVGTAARPNM